MSAKQIKIGYRESYYVVISVKNTTQHLPGEILPRREVDAMCVSHAWDVTLVKLNEEKSS